mmetsp:Transcript_54553/g.173330  ORF Transcript_54553/g.173330 Transcript_54553/m.173330 type:complete len:302 (+) Transcript_54553:1419-2324(+)
MVPPPAAMASTPPFLPPSALAEGAATFPVKPTASVMRLQKYLMASQRAMADEMDTWIASVTAVLKNSATLPDFTSSPAATPAPPAGGVSILLAEAVKGLAAEATPDTELAITLTALVMRRAMAGALIAVIAPARRNAMAPPRTSSGGQVSGMKGGLGISISNTYSSSSSAGLGTWAVREAMGSGTAPPLPLLEAAMMIPDRLRATAAALPRGVAAKPLASAQRSLPPPIVPPREGARAPAEITIPRAIYVCVRSWHPRTRSLYSLFPSSLTAGSRQKLFAGDLESVASVYEVLRVNKEIPI